MLFNTLLGKDKTARILLYNVFLYFIIFNYSLTLYNLSFYYQTICILNTKNNLIYTILIIILIQINYKGLNLLMKYLVILLSCSL